MALISTYICEIIISLFFLLHNLNVNCERNAVLKLEDFIVDFVNGTYIDEETFNLEVVYHSYSDNTLSAHSDIIKELPSPLYFKMSVWGRAFGQYKVPTGINLNINICDKKSMFSVDKLWNIIGLNMTNCPPKPGTYEKNDFSADAFVLPPIALPDVHILTDVEIYSPPDISVIKLRSYYFIS